MKILTTVTASAGLDVASTGSDTIKLGSSNTENNDAVVDNLIVWANADFKNNVTLGNSVNDNTLVNSKLTASNGLYVSGNLYINGVNITASSGGSGSGGGIGEQDVSGALTAYAKSVDVSSSFVDNTELTNSIANFPTRTEVTGATNNALSTVALTYATLTGVSGTFVSNTSATSSLARLASTNTFTANQIISGTLSLNNNINIISSSLGVKHNDIGENIFFGSASAASITSGYRNISFGYRSLNKNTTGYQNIAIGGDSLFSNSSGIENTALGIAALYKNSSGTHNIAIGNASLYSNTAGNNISIGYASQEKKTGGSNTVAIGYETLRYPTTSTNNTIIGNSSLSSVGLINSTRNAVLGYNAGNSLTSLRDSVIIGGNNGSTIDGTTGSIIISDGAGNIRLRADNTGLVSIPGSLTVTGTINNIKFPATQVASADANTLDDYEEGSWTPALTGSTSSNYSYTAQQGRYIKIGRLVTCYGYIRLSSTGSSSGFVSVGNIPFAGNLYGSLYVDYMNAFSASVSTPIRGQTSLNATFNSFSLLFGTDSTSLLNTHLTNTSGFTFLISYQSSS